jgi:peptidoglycan/xylan/chitin deacetylase (PgdA/CDA1 family)
MSQKSRGQRQPARRSAGIRLARFIQGMFERASFRAVWLSVVFGVWLSALPPDAGEGLSAALHPYSSAAGAQEGRASILVYHRFGPVVADSMTVRTRTFRWQLQYLNEGGYHIIPLRALIAWRLGLGPAPPPRSVVLTVDDGHRSVFSEMLPVVREFNVPVTLFVYPSAISNAAYAMTWEQLRTLVTTGLFDVQSHSFWHPNFATERQRRTPAEYRAFALAQLTRSKAVLAERLGIKVDVIAWPFGVYDEELLQLGAEAGYVAGVTLERHVAGVSDPIMALPRFLVTDAAAGRAFASLLPSIRP